MLIFSLGFSIILTGVYPYLKQVRFLTLNTDMGKISFFYYETETTKLFAKNDPLGFGGHS